ncbi:DUF4943 family protein [Echinicola sp. 20G]|uniref:DUF4943 family protein n=1 Tax=Echinicola sp. 20G TaxID=2781961 RepID=UPI00190FCAFB|nr:DUF4943 family protein [Echinicola sp. 20G]
MKSLINFFLILFLLVIVGCKDEFEPPDMTVDHYVELLIAGKYNDSALPAFDSKDIPELLNFRNESQIINNYPISPLSSSLAQECTLGMYVLWTIESIRAKSIGDEYLMGAFPSQLPMVMKKEDFEYIEQNQQVQKEVADSYFNWWESNKDNDFSQFHKVDPLLDTDYRWF